MKLIKSQQRTILHIINLFLIDYGPQDDFYRKIIRIRNNIIAGKP